MLPVGGIREKTIAVSKNINFSELLSLSLSLSRPSVQISIVLYCLRLIKEIMRIYLIISEKGWRYILCHIIQIYLTLFSPLDHTAPDYSNMYYNSFLVN